MSWRNGIRILDAANELVKPLASTLEPLRPDDRASDRADRRRVPRDRRGRGGCGRRLVRAVARRAARGRNPRRAPRCCCAPARRRRSSSMRCVAAACRSTCSASADCVAEPEIADVVSALRVVSDPGAGIQLIRLLSGSRWRSGCADLHALRGVASWLRDRDYAHQPLDDEDLRDLRHAVADRGRAARSSTRSTSSGPSSRSTAQLAAFSAEGVERLRDAGALFARPPRRAPASRCPTWWRSAIQELRLDIEVAANEYRRGARPRQPRRPLRRARRVPAARSPRWPASPASLAWLREAELREDLSPRPEDRPNPADRSGAHGARREGTRGGMPSPCRGWSPTSSRPRHSRGSSAGSPTAPCLSAVARRRRRAAQARVGVGGDKPQAAGGCNQGRFSGPRVRERVPAEERRLAYVAVTARGISAPALRIVVGDPAGAARAGPVPRRAGRARGSRTAARDPARGGQPAGRPDLEVITWPVRPARRRGVRRSRGRREAVRDAEPAVGGPWPRDLQLLLAERAARSAGEHLRRAAAARAGLALPGVPGRSGGRRRIRCAARCPSARSGRHGSARCSTAWVEHRYGLPPPRSDGAGCARRRGVDPDGEGATADRTRPAAATLRTVPVGYPPADRGGARDPPPVRTTPHGGLEDRRRLPTRLRRWQPNSGNRYEIVD